MDKNLLKTLVCPQCHHAVSFDKAKQTLTCAICCLAFPIRDDIPIMLVDEASPLTQKEQ